MVTADHPRNTKRGRVCVYYKESLVIKVLHVSFINEYILCRVNYNIREDILLLHIDLHVKLTMNLIIFARVFHDLLNNDGKSS